MVKRNCRLLIADCRLDHRSMGNGKSAIGNRSGRSTLAVLIFLLLFSALIIFVTEVFLLPAMSVVKNATPPERLRLQAVSTLLLAIVLLILIVGLLLTFRIGRFFFPRPTEPRVQTKYTDAWTEAGRRAKTPDETNESS
jgi:hypothetical protein